MRHLSLWLRSSTQTQNNLLAETMDDAGLPTPLIALMFPSDSPYVGVFLLLLN
jgi:hypothetical protein